MGKRIQDKALDLVAFGSMAAVVYGVALIHPPSAYIVGGLAVLTATILRARYGLSN